MQPGCDLFSAARDESGSRVVVPQQVIPKRQPVFGIGQIVGQQFANELIPLVGFLTRQEFVELFGSGQQPIDVQCQTPIEGCIGNPCWSSHLLAYIVRIDNAIDGVLTPIRSGWQFDSARFQGWFIGDSLKAESLFPLGPGIDPGRQSGDLIGGNAIPFRRHHQSCVIRLQSPDQFALATLSGDGSLACFAPGQQLFSSIHREATLLLVAGMTLPALLTQDRHNVVCKIDICR